MRRLPPAVWILAPLCLGLLYYVGYGLLLPAPGLATLPPENAVVVQRFRNLEILDRDSFTARDPNGPPPSAFIARNRNNPRLAGVDREGPIHLIMLPPSSRDATMVVFPLQDPEAFEHAFERHGLDDEYVRHAQFLEVRGPWAAVGSDPDAVRRIGTGGITCEDLGEDHAIAARIPDLVTLAAASARVNPWRRILDALGVDTKSPLVERDTATGALTTTFRGTSRLARILAGWLTGRMWSWRQDGRLRIDLEPAPGPLRDALAALAASPQPARTGPPPPEDARLWIHVPGALERKVLALALYHAGVPFPPPTADVPADADARWWLAGLVEERGDEDGGLLLWGVRTAAHPYALTLGIAAPRGALPDLAAFLGAVPEPGSSTAVAEGALPLTIIDHESRRTSPAGTLERRLVGDYDVLTIGAWARAALDRFAADLQIAAPFTPPAAPSAGLRRVASFAIDAPHAQKLLGPALGAGGFLACLFGGRIDGALWTDGRTLRLEARVTRR